MRAGANTQPTGKAVQGKQNLAAGAECNISDGHAFPYIAAHTDARHRAKLRSPNGCRMKFDFMMNAAETPDSFNLNVGAWVGELVEAIQWIPELSEEQIIQERGRDTKEGGCCEEDSGEL